MSKAESIPEKLLHPYDPSETEPRIQALELATPETSINNPDVLVSKQIIKPDAEPYTIVLPPPNVTGVLHLGHGLMVTIQDILIRKARMEGKKILWIPGTDHAAIATQAVVEKEISKKENKSRYDIGRDELVKRIEDYAEKSHDTIVSQIKRLGASLDWSREAYTLDESRNLAVRTIFKKMYDDGLIYRGFRTVNWDPKGQTTIADDEIVYKEEKTKLYYLKYGPFTIATARPETKFGDKYIVMHPDDARYKNYENGQRLQIEWINGPIEATIIKDESIDMEFGTGVMTITPWHSREDFALAEKHGLDKEQIIDKYGKLLPIAKEFSGMKIAEAREKIIEKLQSKGLVEKIDENYLHNIATAERTGGIIEPQIMNQWFVAVNKPFTIRNSEINGIKSGQETTLKEIMKNTVEGGQIEILPDFFDKTYFHWIDKLNDWCISRQIWYGHRIPVWYKSKSGKTIEKTGEINTTDNDIEIYVGIELPKDASEWTQDEDTLDTWFSSGLWTFSTLGWPETMDQKTGKPLTGTDLAIFHPTEILVTGHEILFFWVARMILMTGYELGTIPFKKVYLTGIIRDSQGKKMSKSLGNGVDPIEISNKYGADALRMFYAVTNTPGMDSRIYEDKIKGYKHFCNKLWNITRFILSAIAENPSTEKLNFDKDFIKSGAITEQDKAIYDEWHQKIINISSNLSDPLYKIHIAAEDLYHYIWHTFADHILEDSKIILKTNSENNPTESEIISRAQTLLTILREILLAAHPFMPHITQEIWSLLPKEMREHDMIAIEQWPLQS